MFNTTESIVLGNRSMVLVLALEDPHGACCAKGFLGIIKVCLISVS